MKNLKTLIAVAALALALMPKPALGQGEAKHFAVGAGLGAGIGAACDAKLDNANPVFCAGAATILVLIGSMFFEAGQGNAQASDTGTDILAGTAGAALGSGISVQFNW